MKRSGLSNRFSQEARSQWLFWYECMVCGKNQPDVLHHIISPSLSVYVVGKHNESVLNSCPLHNYSHPNDNGGKSCHVGNEAYLGKNYKMLLQKTLDALRSMGYQLNELDREFLRIYKHLYESDFNS